MDNHSLDEKFVLVQKPLSDGEIIYYTTTGREPPTMYVKESTVKAANRTATVLACLGLVGLLTGARVECGSWQKVWASFANGSYAAAAATSGAHYTLPYPLNNDF